MTWQSTFGVDDTQHTAAIKNVFYQGCFSNCVEEDQWIYGEGRFLRDYPPSTGLIEKDTLEEAQVRLLKILNFEKTFI